MIYKTLFTFIILLTLSGCESEPVYSVEYYIIHPKERVEKLAKCRNNSIEASNNPNCKNAAEAEYKSMFRGNSMPKIK